MSASVTPVPASRLAQVRGPMPRSMSMTSAGERRSAALPDEPLARMQSSRDIREPIIRGPKGCHVPGIDASNNGRESLIAEENCDLNSAGQRLAIQMSTSTEFKHGLLGRLCSQGRYVGPILDEPQAQ